jgi:hypothetical protein
MSFYSPNTKQRKSSLDNFGAWFGLYVADVQLYHMAQIAATISSQIKSSVAADRLQFIAAVLLLECCVLSQAAHSSHP